MKIKILNINVDVIDLDNLFEKLLIAKKTNQKITINYLNIHVANEAYKNKKLLEALNDSDIVYCDGDGIRLGSYLTKQIVPPKNTGADFIDELTAFCEKNNISIFYLGGTKEVSEKAEALFRNKYPFLSIKGFKDGYFDFNDKSVVEEINEASPDLLIVGMGTPAQELWIRENKGMLNAKTIWAIGGTLDYLTGKQKRGSKLMRDLHLEWLGRFLSDPLRLWKRYLIGNCLFLYRVLFGRS
ncbi:MAG: WecB/TagA/CpsF family glycosyltransferase [Pseudomonadota bacterium]